MSIQRNNDGSYTVMRPDGSTIGPVYASSDGKRSAEQEAKHIDKGVKKSWLYSK